MEKPSIPQCKVSGIGQKKFFCGRKKKFGLNMTATCDHKRRFIDIDISHPGATSDYLAFATSSLKRKLETSNLLADGKYIFGDNAYVNTPYLATPFKSPTPEEDHYNFYHSQVRINIECAFGMLINRWTILRRPLPTQMGIGKITALTMCLCKLHNFLIDERIAPTLLQDSWAASIAGKVTINRIGRSNDDNNDAVPSGLLHGGDHFDDVDGNELRRQHYRERSNSTTLPRYILFHSVGNQGLKRPTKNIR